MITLEQRKVIMMFYRLSAVAAILLITAGCCAIFNGKTQTVTINSVPQGAAVYNCYGQYLGVTPLTVPLDRGREQSLELHLNGYLPQVKYFERRIDWWLFPLDFIIWPTIFVDTESGAMYVFKEPNATVKLQPGNLEYRPSATSYNQVKTGHRRKDIDNE